MPPSYAVYDKMFEPLEFGEFLLRDVVHVCAVGYVADAVAQDRQPEMSSPYGDDFYSIDCEWSIIDDVYLPIRGSGVFVFGKGI